MALVQSFKKKIDIRNVHFVKVLYVRIAYNLTSFLQRKNKNYRTTCLNLGLILPKEEALALDPSDENDRIFFQLYYYICRKISFKDKKVLEIGCAFGGGTYFIHKYLNPKHIKGIDLITSQINIAKERYSNRSISFQQGDACKLKEISKSYDLVVNLESSHSYVNFNRFLSGVFQVLKNDGVFIFSDIRFSYQVDQLEKDFDTQGFSIMHKENITSLVLKALYVSDKAKKNIIGEKHPFYFIFKGFAFLRDSKNYNYLKNGDTQYLFYMLKK